MQGEAVLYVAQEQLWGDASMTAAGLATPERRNWMPGHGFHVVKPFKTWSSGFSLAPLPCFLYSLTYIDGRVWLYSWQQNDNWKVTAQCGTPKSFEAIRRQGMTSLKEAIIETIRIGLTSPNMPIPELLGDCWHPIIEYGNIWIVRWKSTQSSILNFDHIAWDYQMNAHIRVSNIAVTILYQTTIPATMPMTISTALWYLIRSDTTENRDKLDPDSDWTLGMYTGTFSSDNWNQLWNRALPIDVCCKVRCDYLPVEIRLAKEGDDYIVIAISPYHNQCCLGCRGTLHHRTHSPIWKAGRRKWTSVSID